MRRDLKDVKPGVFADTAKGFEFGRCEEPPEGPYGRSQGQQEGERQGEQLCCFALTRVFQDTGLSVLNLDTSQANWD